MSNNGLGSVDAHRNERNPNTSTIAGGDRMNVGNLIKDKWGFGVVLKVCWTHKELTVFWVNDGQTSTFPMMPLMKKGWKVLG